MKVLIIIGSTRPGRVSDRLAKWIKSEADKLEPKSEFVIADLVDYELPLLDEPISPQYNPERQPNKKAQKWLNDLADADGYMLITPEYNRSTSAVLKNALDYIDFQFDKKPVAIVSHGSSGGAQAVAHLRGIIPGLKAVSVPAATFVVGQVGSLFDEAGRLDKEVEANPYGPLFALKNTLAELDWYMRALGAGRTADSSKT
jgi:NAD(P)H-dependent FMN reductase